MAICQTEKKIKYIFQRQPGNRCAKPWVLYNNWLYKRGHKKAFECILQPWNWARCHYYFFILLLSRDYYCHATLKQKGWETRGHTTTGPDLNMRKRVVWDFNIAIFLQKFNPNWDCTRCSQEDTLRFKRLHCSYTGASRSVTMHAQSEPEARKLRSPVARNNTPGPGVYVNQTGESQGRSSHAPPIMML